LSTKIATLKDIFLARIPPGKRHQVSVDHYTQGGRRRISPRRVQFAFRTWQVRAGFDRLYPLHALRHTAITAVYRASRDLFLAQRFARHASPLTTVYTQPSDQGIFERVRQLP